MASRYKETNVGLKVKVTVSLALVSTEGEEYIPNMKFLFFDDQNYWSRVYSGVITFLYHFIWRYGNDPSCFRY